MKSFLVILIIAATAFAGGSDLVLERYIQEALQENPSLKAAIARVGAFNEKIPQSSALPEPMLGFGLANLPVNSFEFSQEPMTGKWISLSQTLPFPGKLGLRRDLAESGRDRQAALLKGEEARIIRLIKETYYQWAFVRESIRLVESHQSLMDQFVAITTSKYEVGDGLGQDVLRAQTERTKFEDRLLKLHQMEETLKARLSALLSREADGPLEVPSRLDFRTVGLDADSLDALISDFNPEVQAFRAREQNAKAGLRLARRSTYPDLKVGVQYTQRDDSPSRMTRHDFFSIKAEIAIPLYWKKRQAHLIEQKRIERRQVDEEFQSLLNELDFQLHDLLVQAKRTRDQITVYREGIIPLAEQTLQSALTGYPVGKVDFLTLLSSQGMLLNYELELRQRILEHELVWARIEAMTGQRII